MNILENNSWRIKTLIEGMKYAKGYRGRFLKGLITDASRTPYVLQTPLGEFQCPDVASAYQFSKSWEPEVRKVVGDCVNGVFVDIGANIGFYSVMAAKQGVYVISIEPNDDAYLCLVQNMISNIGGTNLEPYFADGARDKWKAIQAAAWYEGNKLVRLIINENTDISQVSDEEGELVRAVDIDYALDGLEADLIKIDVEGSELQVLKGMSKTLDSFPDIIFEALNDKALEGCSTLLRSKGYSICQLDRTNYLAC